MAVKANFFGEVDQDVRGNIASEYPAWYFETHLGNMKEECESLIRRIERGEIPQDSVPQASAEVRNMKERIAKIEESKPELTDKERDELLGMHKYLSEKIADSMFTRSEMKMGTASANEEARRMIEPKIPLYPKLFGAAKLCNVNVVNGKVSRNDATKIWKILGKLTGVGTNVEGLRRDRATTLTGA